MTTLRLLSNGPVNLKLCNQPLTELDVDRAAWRDGVIYRATRIDSVPVIIKGTNISDTELEFDIAPAMSTPLPDKSAIVAALRRKFNLDLDLPAFYQFLQSQRELADLPMRQSGLRPMQKDTLLEALWQAVMDQQVNVAFASTLKRRLLENYGERFEVDGLTLWLMPQPEQMASLDPHVLTPYQFTRNRSSYIVGLASTFLEQPEWEMLTGADDYIVKQLCKLRGVGPWTAEYAAMVGLGLVDTLPAADIGLLNIVQQVYQMEDRPTPDQVRELGQKWSPWRGLVTFYLWHKYETEE